MSRAYTVYLCESVEPFRSLIGNSDLTHPPGQWQEDRNAMAEFDGLVEDGSWQAALEAYGEELGLLKRPVNECESWRRFTDFFRALDGALPSEAQSLMDFLMAGRPFQGQYVSNADGHYGWLEHDESILLLEALTNTELRLNAEQLETHHHWISILKACRKHEKGLMLFA